MRKLRWLVPIVAVLAIAAFVAVEIWGGVSRSATSILRDADRVEVFRVQSQVVDSHAQLGPLGGYPVLAVGKELGPDFAKRLGKVLRSWAVAPSSKKCVFEPGVAFRVWAGDRSLEVLICFKCDDLWPRVVGENKTLHGEVLAFDPVRAELVALVKEALPDDPKIQALPEVHPGESAFFPESATATTLPKASTSRPGATDVSSGRKPEK